MQTLRGWKLEAGEGDDCDGVFRVVGKIPEWSRAAAASPANNQSLYSGSSLALSELCAHTGDGETGL